MFSIPAVYDTFLEMGLGVMVFMKLSNLGWWLSHIAGKSLISFSGYGSNILHLGMLSPWYHRNHRIEYPTLHPFPYRISLSDNLKESHRCRCIDFIYTPPPHYFVPLVILKYPYQPLYIPDPWIQPQTLHEHALVHLVVGARWYGWIPSGTPSPGSISSRMVTTHEWDTYLEHHTSKPLVLWCMLLGT